MGCVAEKCCDLEEQCFLHGDLPIKARWKGRVSDADVAYKIRSARSIGQTSRAPGQRKYSIDYAELTRSLKCTDSEPFTISDSQLNKRRVSIASADSYQTQEFVVGSIPEVKVSDSGRKPKRSILKNTEALY